MSHKNGRYAPKVIPTESGEVISQRLRAPRYQKLQEWQALQRFQVHISRSFCTHPKSLVPACPFCSEARP